ncbi:MAG: hypothetical protein FWC13_05235 [Oscillospiraceae bacterium]|nr:hypothetical protein [Oscillospiraceae bacterium]
MNQPTPGIIPLKDLKTSKNFPLRTHPPNIKSTVPAHETEKSTQERWNVIFRKAFNEPDFARAATHSSNQKI